MSNKVLIKSQQRKSLDVEIRQYNRRLYFVYSSSRSGVVHCVKVHVVKYKHKKNELRVRCDCEWDHHGGEGCVHALAVLRHLAGLKNRQLSFWDNEEEARAQKHSVVKVGKNIWATVRKAR